MTSLHELEGVCDYCGEVCDSTVDELNALNCTFDGCRNPMVYHQHCVEAYLKSNRMDKQRKTGFQCPRGNGKASPFDKPCPGRVTKSHPIHARNDNSKKRRKSKMPDVLPPPAAAPPAPATPAAVASPSKSSSDAIPSKQPVKDSKKDPKKEAKKAVVVKKALSTDPGAAGKKKASLTVLVRAGGSGSDPKKPAATSPDPGPPALPNQSAWSGLRVLSSRQKEEEPVLVVIPKAKPKVSLTDAGAAAGPKGGRSSLDGNLEAVLKGGRNSLDESAVEVGRRGGRHSLDSQEVGRKGVQKDTERKRNQGKGHGADAQSFSYSPPSGKEAGQLGQLSGEQKPGPIAGKKAEGEEQLPVMSTRSEVPSYSAWDRGAAGAPASKKPLEATPSGHVLLQQDKKVDAAAMKQSPPIAQQQQQQQQSSVVVKTPNSKILGWTPTKAARALVAAPAAPASTAAVSHKADKNSGKVHPQDLCKLGKVDIESIGEGEGGKGAAEEAVMYQAGKGGTQGGQQQQHEQQATQMQQQQQQQGGAGQGMWESNPQVVLSAAVPARAPSSFSLSDARTQSQSRRGEGEEGGRTEGGDAEQQRGGGAAVGAGGRQWTQLCLSALQQRRMSIYAHQLSLLGFLFPLALRSVQAHGPDLLSCITWLMRHQSMHFQGIPVPHVPHASVVPQDISLELALMGRLVEEGLVQQEELEVALILTGGNIDLILDMLEKESFTSFLSACPIPFSSTAADDERSIYLGNSASRRSSTPPFGSQDTSPILGSESSSLDDSSNESVDESLSADLAASEGNAASEAKSKFAVPFGRNSEEGTVDDLLPSFLV